MATKRSGNIKVWKYSARHRHSSITICPGAFRLTTVDFAAIAFASQAHAADAATDPTRSRVANRDAPIRCCSSRAISLARCRVAAKHGVRSHRRATGGLRHNCRRAGSRGNLAKPSATAHKDMGPGGMAADCYCRPLWKGDSGPGEFAAFSALICPALTGLRHAKCVETVIYAPLRRFGWASTLPGP